MAKARSKQQPAVSPAIRLSALRPRLDQLFRNEPLPAPDPQALYQALDGLTEGLAPEKFLPALLAATAAAPQETQEQLGDALQRWLEQRGYTIALRQVAQRGALDSEQRQLALAWLASAGGDLALSIEPDDSFYAAYYVGNEAQGTIMFFWYDSPRRNRASGLGLLLDYEPPWEGAVKDAIPYPRRDPEALIQRFVGMWAEQGLLPEQLTASVAKRRALEALEQNRHQNIGLHRDLIAARDQFVRHILSLPDEQGTPAFSAEDFDYLAHNGRKPEILNRQEKQFGYQVRQADGSILRIMRTDNFDDE